MSVEGAMMTMQPAPANMMQQMPMGTPLVAEAVAPGAMPMAGGTLAAAPMAPTSTAMVGIPMVQGGMPMTDPMVSVAPASYQVPVNMGNTFAAAEAAAKAEGTPKQALDLKHERLVGTILSYQPVNGSGYVKSHLFEGEVFFRTERLMPEFLGHPFQQGESVEFDVQVDENGRAHAVMMKPVLGRNPKECIGQRHRGYVRRFAERWGFLNAAAFDGDLFVHRDNLLPAPDQYGDSQPNLGTGQAVEFDVALDDRGRAVAKQITTRALLRPCDWIGNRLRGFIRSFQGAWGFINSDRFAGDLFVHRDSLLAQYQGLQLTVGTIVEFDVERDHHRKGTKNRLVARHVAVLGGAEAPQQVQPTTYTPTVASPMPGALPAQHAVAMDPYGAMQTAQPLTGYGALNPAAPNFAPAAQTSPVYYQQGTAPAPMTPDQMGAAGMYAAQPYQYAQQQYMQQPMMPPQQMPPLQQPQVLAQSPYAQYQYAPPSVPQPQMTPMPTMPPQMPVQSNAYMPTGMPPTTAEDQQRAAAQTALLQQQMQTAVQPPGQAPPSGSEPVATEGPQQGLLHITMHDWEPDQPGQLWVTKGTLVNVSYRAAHGWVYAGTVQPGSETSEPASEGWIPQAVVKRISLCRVAIDWPAEGTGTLGVIKGEIIAVSKQAERGWVYGERIGPRQPDRPVDGWLPRKVLDYLQA